MASSQPQKNSQPTPSNEAGKPEDAPQKSAAALEEDDEFEDFPVEGMYDSTSNRTYPSLSPPTPFCYYPLSYIPSLKQHTSARPVLVEGNLYLVSLLTFLAIVP